MFVGEKYSLISSSISPVETGASEGIGRGYALEVSAIFQILLIRVLILYFSWSDVV